MAVVLGACVVTAVAAGVMLRPPGVPADGARTVGAYFDVPPAWPGPAWRHGNRTASWPELDASAGGRSTAAGSRSPS